MWFKIRNDWNNLLSLPPHWPLEILLHLTISDWRHTRAPTVWALCAEGATLWDAGHCAAAAQPLELETDRQVSDLEHIPCRFLTCHMFRDSRGWCVPRVRSLCSPVLGSSLVPFCVAIENKMLHGQDFLALLLARTCHVTPSSQWQSKKKPEPSQQRRSSTWIECSGQDVKKYRRCWKVLRL